MLHGDLSQSLALFPALIPILLTFAFVFLHLRLKFRHGAKVTMILFISSTAIMLISYGIKVATHGFYHV